MQLGKESNKFEEVKAGLEHDPESIWTVYADPRRDQWETELLPILKKMRLADIAAGIGLSERRFGRFEMALYVLELVCETC